LSGSVIAPHFAPSREHSAASLSGVQPHTFVSPPPPQVSGLLQAPQETLRFLLHESVKVAAPQFFPEAAQSVASPCPVQPHTLGFPPPPHVAGAWQLPQVTTDRALSQLSNSAAAPQSFPRRWQNSRSVSGLHTP
jgi:hypothetical protein